MKKFNDFLKIVNLYKLKQIPRSNSNHYHDEKDNISHKRRETTAEHVYSVLRLADYFLTNEKEFENLDKLKVYELLMYHDDIEMETRDINIKDREARLSKEDEEIKALPILSEKYPKGLNKKLITLDSEFREKVTPEAKFSNSIDKLDAMIHELEYPQDWGPKKGFDEKNIRAWSGPAFIYSETFTKYFEDLIIYLNEKDYFLD